MRDIVFWFGLICVTIGLATIGYALWDKMREEEREAERLTGPMRPWEPPTAGHWATPGYTFRHQGKAVRRGARRR